MDSFKQFVNNQITVISPKPYKDKIIINLSEYKDMVTECVLKNERKALIKQIVSNSEIPVFCEEREKFYMCNVSSKKKRTREVKSREDKSLCGALLNGMIVYEHKKNNTERVDYLKNMNLSWEVPNYVLVEQDRHKK